MRITARTRQKARVPENTGLCANWVANQGLKHKTLQKSKRTRTGDNPGSLTFSALSVSRTVLQSHEFRFPALQQ